MMPIKIGGQVAYIFTKGLNDVKTEKFQKLLGMVSRKEIISVEGEC